MSNDNIENSSELAHVIACPECDLLMTNCELKEDEHINCNRCGSLLNTHYNNMPQKALALVFTALVLFIPASFLPILQIDILGLSREASVWDSVLGLYHSNMEIISVLVLSCGLVIPLCKLIFQLYVLLAIKFNKTKHIACNLFKSYQELKEWGMLEIYLLGILVSIVKLHGMAELHISMGLICFIMLLFVQVWLEIVMNAPQTWRLLGEIDDRS